MMQVRQLRFWKTCVSLLILLAVAEVASADGLSVADLIEKVRSNEKHYKEIDLTLRHVYRFGDSKELDDEIEKREMNPNAAQGPRAIAINLQESQIHFVGQTGMFRGDRKGIATASYGARGMDRICAFDGKMTRVYDQNAGRSVFDLRVEDENVIRPHMLMLRFMQYHVPLSTYMSGHKAMAADPGANWQSGYTIETESAGVADFNGLKCHKFWITTTAASPNDRWEIWLAEERNFIPVRILGYTFRFSEKEPVAEGIVKKWREVEPGVWFPVVTSVTAFNQPEIKATGRRKTQWTDTLLTNKISLHPKFESSYFQDLSLPKGTTVQIIPDSKLEPAKTQGAASGP